MSLTPPFKNSIPKSRSFLYLIYRYMQIPILNLYAVSTTDIMLLEASTACIQMILAG